MWWMSMGEPACMQLPLEGNLTHRRWWFWNLGIFIPCATYKQWRFCFPGWITVSAFYSNKFCSVILQLFKFSCLGFSFFPWQKHRLSKLIVEQWCWPGYQRSFGEVSSPEIFFTSTRTEVTCVPLIAGLLCITLLLTRTVSVLSHWWELVLKSMSLTSQAAVLCTVPPLHSTFLGEEILSEVKQIFIKFISIQKSSKCPVTLFFNAELKQITIMKKRNEKLLCELHKLFKSKEYNIWYNFCKKVRFFSSLLRCLDYLLDSGANPILRNSKGYSAVHYAAAYGNKQHLELVGGHFRLEFFFF